MGRQRGLVPEFHSVGPELDWVGPGFRSAPEFDLQRVGVVRGFLKLNLGFDPDFQFDPRRVELQRGLAVLGVDRVLVWVLVRG